MVPPTTCSAAAEPVSPMLPAVFRVRQVRRELADTWTLDLEPGDGRGSFRFAPGQFTMLYAFGVGEVPVSISGDPAKPERLVHTIRAVGATTRAICAMKRGAALGVRGPYGNPWPLAECEGRDVVLVAGGIGLAPLRPAIYHLIAHRDKFGKVVLLVGARTPADLLFNRELERWRGRFDLDVRVTVDSASADWRGDVGVVTVLIPRAGFDPARAVALVCGPEVMMRYCVAELRKQGMDLGRVHISMERNMRCAVAFCGHCQLGPTFVCKDGPVFPYTRMEPFLKVREI